MSSNLFQRLAVLAILAAGLAAQPAQAQNTAAGQNMLRIQNSLPKKTSDSLFAYTAEWRIDDGEIYRATGIAFLNAAKLDSHATAALVSKKLLTAIKDGLIQLDPNWRGITVNQPQDQAELLISNRSGYSFTNIIVRDYSNQALGFEAGDKSFNAAGVQAAIDLVLAANVEYLDGFSSKKSQTASQGEIIISFDDQKPVHIQTDGKTTAELEQEIARQLAGSQLSNTSLFPMLINLDTRNNKPFDGSEIQLLNLNAKTIHIEITDPSLGVLSKFKYADGNATAKLVEPKFIMIILALLGLGVSVYLWKRKAKKGG